MKTKDLLSIIFVISIIFVSILQYNVYAANASITASKTSIEKGQTININANISSASSWALDAQASGGTFTKSDDRVGNTNSGDNENTTVKLGTFTANTAGTYTITLSGYVVDGETLSKTNVSGSVKITVNEPATTPPPSSGGNTGGSTGGSTSGSTGGSTGGGTTTTPTAPKFTDVSKTVYTTGDINLRASWSTSSAATRVSKGTELRLTGTSTEKVNGYVWYRVTYNGQIKYVSKDLITETKPEEKSSSANLKTLAIEGVELTPAFSTDVTEYSVKLVDFNGTDINVTAEAEDEKSVVKVVGNTNLVVGENVITVTVTAEDGTTKIYTITVVKEETKAFGLSNLTIKDIELKGFMTEKYDYEVSFEGLYKLEIEAIASEEGATIEILGNENLVEGENLITIIVTSADGSKTATYQIKANKLVTENEQENKQLNGKTILISALIAFAVLIVIIILVIKYVRNSNKPTIDYTYNDNLDNDEVKGKNDKNDTEMAKEITPNKEETKKNTKVDDLFDDIEETPRKRGKGKHSK